MRSDRIAARVRSAALGSGELAVGATAIEGKSLGHRRYGWEGWTAANFVCRLGKELIDVWLRDSRVTEGKVFRRVSKNGARTPLGEVRKRNLAKLPHAH
jgi:hypothetical protein